jgi:hypothetical protein
MTLSIYNFTSRIYRALSDRQFAETPPKPAPQMRLANFIADSRVRYAEKKKNLSPNDKKYPAPTIWYFSAAVLVVLLLQNFLGSSHVEVVGYSQFNSLLKKI